jgi:YVTN family beta-propeller protein
LGEPRTPVCHRMPKDTPDIAYPEVAHGTILLPQHFRALFRFVYDPSVSLTEYRSFTDDYLSNNPEDIKARFSSYIDRLKVSKVSGLSLRWAEGALRFGDGQVLNIAAGTGNAINNTTSFVFVNEDGVVTISAIRPPQVFLLAEVLASGGNITSVIDKRTNYSVSIPVGGDAGIVAIAADSVTDFPEGTAGKGLRVNPDESGFEYYEIPGLGAGSARYSPIARIQVVDGSQISIAAGITEIRSDAALFPELSDADNRVSVSSTYSDSFAPWKALNGAIGPYDAWASGADPTPSVPQWWQFDFGATVSLGRVIITDRDMPRGWWYPVGTHMPVDFKIQGSANGTTFTDLLDVSNQPLWGNAESRSFALSSVQTLRYFRISATEVYYPPGYSGSVLTIPEIQAYSGLTPTTGVAQVSGGMETVYQAMLKGVSVAGSKVFVSCGYLDRADKILRIDTAKRAIEGDFDLGDAKLYQVSSSVTSAGGTFAFRTTKYEEYGPIACLDSANKVYVGVGSKIFVYNELNGNLLKTIDCGKATEIKDLGLSLEQSKLYAISKVGVVVVVETTSDEIVATLNAATSPEFAGELDSVAIDDTRDAVYVTNSATNKVVVINTITNTLVTTISVGTEPQGIALSPTLGKALVCNASGNLVSVINTTANSVSASIAMSLVGSNGRPVSAAIDAANGVGFVVLENYHQVVAIDLSTNQIEARIPVDPSPVEAVWIDATQELYVVSAGGGISVVKKVAA